MRGAHREARRLSLHSLVGLLHRLRAFDGHFEARLHVGERRALILALHRQHLLRLPLGLLVHHLDTLLLCERLRQLGLGHARPLRLGVALRLDAAHRLLQRRDARADFLQPRLQSTLVGLERRMCQCRCLCSLLCCQIIRTRRLHVLLLTDAGLGGLRDELLFECMRCLVTLLLKIHTPTLGRIGSLERCLLVRLQRCNFLLKMLLQLALRGGRLLLGRRWDHWHHISARWHRRQVRRGR